MIESQHRIISPQDRRMMEQEGILFVHSKEELRKYGYNATGQTIELLLGAWTGTPYPDWSLLNGANVLDIGAGSHLNGDNGAPWFARICAVNGANVVIADILPQSEADQKLFESIIDEDIIPSVMSGQLAQLPQLQGRMFEIIHSMNLIGFNPDPGLERELKRQGINLAKFESCLVQQSKDLLTEGGVMYLGQFRGLYKKVKTDTPALSA